MELESWEASAYLQIHEAKDSRNAGILLVEDYGSLLARAGELSTYFSALKLLIRSELSRGRINFSNNL